MDEITYLATRGAILILEHAADHVLQTGPSCKDKIVCVSCDASSILCKARTQLEEEIGL